MITAEKQEVLRWFAEGRKAYKLMDFAKASAIVKALLTA